MAKHEEKNTSLKFVEMSNGWRAGIIGTAVVGVVALIGLLVVGFRGRHIQRNAAAMTMPLVGSIKSETPHPAAGRPL
jgi:hypothetical protein